MPECLTANQLVAYNLTRVRKMRGMSQQQAADALAPYLGVRWSKAVYSAAERSYHGKRVRQFTADDVLAMALTFGVPIAYFYLPPKPEDRPDDAVACSGDTEVGWPGLFEAMFGGEYRLALTQRAFELPREERVPADGYLARIINGMGSPNSLEEARELAGRFREAFPEPS